MISRSANLPVIYKDLKAEQQNQALIRFAGGDELRPSNNLRSLAEDGLLNLCRERAALWHKQPAAPYAPWEARVIVNILQGNQKNRSSLIDDNDLLDALNKGIKQGFLILPQKECEAIKPTPALQERVVEYIVSQLNAQSERGWRTGFASLDVNILQSLVRGKKAALNINEPLGNLAIARRYMQLGAEQVMPILMAALNKQTLENKPNNNQSTTTKKKRPAQDLKLEMSIKQLQKTSGTGPSRSTFENIAESSPDFASQLALEWLSRYGAANPLAALEYLESQSPLNEKHGFLYGTISQEQIDAIASRIAKDPLFKSSNLVLPFILRAVPGTSSRKSIELIIKTLAEADRTPSVKVYGTNRRRYDLILVNYLAKCASAVSECKIQADTGRQPLKKILLSIVCNFDDDRDRLIAAIQGLQYISTLGDAKHVYKATLVDLNQERLKKSLALVKRVEYCFGVAYRAHKNSYTNKHELIEMLAALLSVISNCESKWQADNPNYQAALYTGHYATLLSVKRQIDKILNAPSVNYLPSKSEMRS